MMLREEAPTLGGRECESSSDHPGITKVKRLYRYYLEAVKAFPWGINRQLLRGLGSVGRGSFMISCGMSSTERFLGYRVRKSAESRGFEKWGLLRKVWRTGQKVQEGQKVIFYHYSGGIPRSGAQRTSNTPWPVSRGNPLGCFRGSHQELRQRKLPQVTPEKRG